MCLRINKEFSSKSEAQLYYKDPFIAKNNIVVYKVLIRPNNIKNKAKSPYQCFKYKRGIKYTSNFYFNIFYVDFMWNINIEDGLHSWSSVNPSCNSLLYDEKITNGFVTKMIIPKGSKYFIGDKGDIVSDQLIWPSYLRLLFINIKQFINENK